MSIINQAPNLKLIEPLSYIPFMNLVFNSRMVLTDSGGLQGETTFLGIPCITLRQNTEWPITIDPGTNRLCSPEELEKTIDQVIQGELPAGSVPELWDGKTATRVVQSIRRFLHS